MTRVQRIALARYWWRGPDRARRRGGSPTEIFTAVLLISYRRSWDVFVPIATPLTPLTRRSVDRGLLWLQVRT